MAQEIERKFLVTSEDWKRDSESVHDIRQAYLATEGKASIRIRIIDGAEAFLTIKSATPGTARAEFEYAVPVADAEKLIHLHIGHVIAKRRHIVRAAGSRWEVDVFEGVHNGLVIAEIELDAPDAAFARPSWLGAEVTADKRYYNASLARRPV
jgi:adenylate cyclase